MSSLTLLGTGTCQIESERRASSVLLELDDLRVLFDCGRGVVQRLLEVGVRPNTLEHVIVSHFHPDHVSDLVPLLQAGAWSRRDPRDRDLHIYGPSGVRRLIAGFTDLFGENSLRRPHYQMVVHEITEDHFQIGAQRFAFRSLPPAGNHGLRFTWKGKRYALTGDSHFHAEERALLKGVDLAVIDSGHIEDAEIVQLAAQSQAKVIVCSHLYRELDAPRLQAEAEAAGYQGMLIVGRDLMTFVL